MAPSRSIGGRPHTSGGTRGRGGSGAAVRRPCGTAARPPMTARALRGSPPSHRSAAAATRRIADRTGGVLLRPA
eukprot:3441484-Pyramimonas_sp.AAC.1